MSEININMPLDNDMLTDYPQYFFDKNKTLIDTLGRKSYNNNSTIAIRSFETQVLGALYNATNYFISKNYSPNMLERYLYGTIQRTAKNVQNENKQLSLICPGCLSENHTEFVQILNNHLQCSNCVSISNLSNDPKKVAFHNHFVSYSQSGYKCRACLRFIPKSNSNIIVCPYPDCSQEFTIKELSIMSNPRIMVNSREALIGTISGGKITDPDITIIKEDLKLYLETLKSCINDQQKALKFSGWSCMYVQKYCIYEAFKNLLEREETEMVAYLCKLGNIGRKNNIQPKLLQEFIRILEAHLPFRYTINGEENIAENIMDKKLNIFSGQTTFKTKVNSKYKIHNKTQEIYKDGKSQKYHQPYFIGKLQNIVNIQTGKSLINKVIDYSFIEINLQEDILPGTEVEVQHLMIVPHYGQKSLSQINRVRKHICDRVQIRLNQVKTNA